MGIGEMVGIREGVDWEVQYDMISCRAGSALVNSQWWLDTGIVR